MIRKLFPFLLGCLLLSGCSRGEELSEEAIGNLSIQGLQELLALTVTKPYRGEAFTPGRIAGTWHNCMPADPKSFNILVAEQDSATNSVVNSMLDYLVDYDPISRTWKPQAASFEIQINESRGTLDIIYTLREDLFWT